MTDASLPADLELRTLQGERLPWSRFNGQVRLVVNTASACGFTPQLAGLQALQQRYGPRGFTVIGFPCNQFGRQEPGDAAAIGASCSANYGVTFPLMAKCEVNGPRAHPLFTWLKAQAPGLLGTRAIKWNFTKFLLGRDGRVIARYAPRQAPETLAADIEAALQPPPASGGET